MICDSTQCLIRCLVPCIIWLFVSSGLLFLTWNKVIATVSKVKTVKYWQVLLLLVTICSLCGPRYIMKNRHHCGKGECPYEKSEKK